MVKNLPANAGKMDSLGWEDPLEKKMTTHCSNLAWGIPGKDVLSGLESMGSQRVGHDRLTNNFTFSERSKVLFTNRL